MTSIVAPSSGLVREIRWCARARLRALTRGANDLTRAPRARRTLRSVTAYNADASLPAVFVTSVIDLAAAYTFGIVRNHPFVDGNKRTGFVVGLLFLERRRRRAAPEEDAAQAAFSLADGSLDEAGYAAFLRANTKLP